MALPLSPDLANSVIDRLLGIAPPDVPVAPAPQQFQATPWERILEGFSGADLPTPHGNLQGFAAGLLGSLGRRGTAVASARQKFEARQLEQTKVNDEARRKATEEYNARRANAFVEAAKEQRGAQAQIGKEQRAAAAEAVPIDETMVKRFPSLAPFQGQSWSPDRLKYYTEETPAEKAAARAGAEEQVMSPDAIKGRVSIFRAGGPEPPMGMGKGGIANRNAFNNELARQMKAEGLSGGDIMAARSQQVADKASLVLLTRNLGMVKQQEATARANADVMLRTASKIPETGVPVLNAILRPGAEKLFGSKEVAEFNTALQTVQPEFARILTMGPTGGGLLSDSARKELQAMLSGNFTRAQLRGSIAILFKDAANRTKGQQGEIDATMKRLSQIGSASSRIQDQTPDFDFVPGQGLVKH